MPYSRRRRAVKPRAKKSGQLLNKRQKKEVKMMIAKDIEIKSIALGQGPAVVTTAGTITSYSPIIQGTANAQRIGDEVNLHSLQFSYEVYTSTNGILGAADVYDSVRLIVFRWRGTNATAPVVADILDTSGTDATLFPYNFSNRTKYHICYDRNHVLANTPIWNGANTLYEQGPGAVWASKKPINLSGKKLGAKKITYNPTSTVVGEEFLYTLVISNSGFVPHPTITIDARLMYTDS